MSRKPKQQRKNGSGGGVQKPPKDNVPKVDAEKSIEKDIPSPSVAPQFPQPEVKAQSGGESKIVKWGSRTLLVLILCYVIPCVFKAFFAVIGYSQPTLDSYIISIDRPLAWASLVLAIVSLYNGSKSDKAASETTKLIQDMQGVITGLNWKIDTTNAMLKGMYTAKSGTEKTSESPDIAPGSGWDIDSVRKVEADQYMSHTTKNM